MQKYLLTKPILAIGALLCFALWWNWPAEKSTEVTDVLLEQEPKLSSKIHAIENAQAQSEGVSLRNEMQKSFDRARTAIINSENKTAINILTNLINEHPSYAELYINLASAYAANGQFNEAKDSLVSGINLDKKSSIIYANLQKVHGALAANAYQRALLDKSDPIDSLILPRAKIIDFSQIDQQYFLKMKEKVQIQADQLDSMSQLVQSKTNKLEEANKQIVRLQTDIQAISKVDEEKANETTKNEEQVANLLKQITDLEAQQESINRQQRVDQELSIRESTIKANQDKDAVLLVKSWATAWSMQDVGLYTSHYSNAYAPGMSHALWLEQRKIRLTNKSFIKVSVSDFVVARTKHHFSVTFIQRYQSDTLDDTIHKRLSFRTNMSDWSQAKIVGEKVIQ